MRVISIESGPDDHANSGVNEPLKKEKLHLHRSTGKRSRVTIEQSFRLISNLIALCTLLLWLAVACTPGFFLSGTTSQVDTA